MKIPKAFENFWFTLGTIVVLIGTVVIVYGTVIENSCRLEGDVIGDNPAMISECSLPVCNFTGAGFVELPCFSPEGSFYL